ncbi:MAG TPA: GNAT family N-acetyltransferase [Candidatus Polarisedimenticolaceae bacterium]|nr:GNAT family N-acetyltransferase [Candidatus Polarisedimenticolaceae bacterium]
MTGIAVRTALRAGDLDEIVRLHGTVYASECGFNATFETYVAGPLAAFGARTSRHERIWIAESEGRIVGCIAIVDTGTRIAQLRWYLVSPAARGAGLGTALLDEAIAFARQSGYRTIFLWTVSLLTAAARRYEAAGFAKVEERAGRHWGVEVVEERYDLMLADNAGHLPNSRVS